MVRLGGVKRSSGRTEPPWDGASVTALQPSHQGLLGARTLRPTGK